MMGSKRDLVAELDVCIRPATDDDTGFVLDTWGRSLRREYPEVRTIDFVAAVRAGYGQRMAFPRLAQVHVAHPREAREVILGWAMVGILSRVHYMYVRPEYRRGGIARHLLGSACDLSKPLIALAMTEDARAIKRSHPDAIRYLPTI